MTDYKKYINALRKCAKEYENDRTFTGHIIVADLCRDTANLLEELEQKPYEMTAEEYRQRMIQAFHNADCDELIALVVLPTEKEFEHLGWLLEKHYKTKSEPSEDVASRECNNCAYYVNGANDEACDGCFADEYEHPNFKPKAQHCGDYVSRQAVLDIAKSSKSNWIDNSVLFKRVNDLPPVTPPEGFPYDDFLSRKERLNMLMETGEFDFLKDISPDKIWKLVFMLEFIGSTESEKYIWVVTYYDFNTELIITVFDNEEAANICYKHFKKYHDICCLDKCPIYSIFEVIKST